MIIRLPRMLWLLRFYFDCHRSKFEFVLAPKKWGVQFIFSNLFSKKKIGSYTFNLKSFSPSKAALTPFKFCQPFAKHTSAISLRVGLGYFLPNESGYQRKPAHEGRFRTLIRPKTAERGKFVMFF